MLIEGFQAWAARMGGLRFVAQARTVGELLGDNPGSLPDVTVLDLFLPDHSAPDTNVRRLVGTGHRVVVYGAAADSARMASALLAGAHGYVHRDQDLNALAAAIRAVATGEAVCPRQFLATISLPCRPRLSDREHAVLLAYGSGMTLKAVASHIGISIATAKTYLERVKAKYEQAGRPAYTKLELAARLREDDPAEQLY
ncbi:LuxR C-terminal-related transcriptional regulator [Nonomuraea sp. NPDC002799]